MCYYITGMISKRSNMEYINMVATVFDMEFRRCKNRFVQAQLESDEYYIRKYSEFCDCDTPLGLKRRKQPELCHLKVDFQLENWINFINIIIVEKRLTDKFGILLHFYEDGKPEKEDIRIKARKPVKATKSRLMNIEEDVLYVFGA
ncbi:MAG: hypothetical protein LBQ97_01500 [Fusobacteriaceae bacterium]|nr:hypothetical protein [Fusobacteriaceae bacterium]